MKTRRLQILSGLAVALLVGGCGLWVWQAKRQYRLNRALIAALVKHDSKQALVLVNAGADSNTRFTPQPAPTLYQLFRQLLHGSPVSPAYRLTAFMFVCGATGDKPEYVPEVASNFWQEVTLVHAMLAHGADCNAKDTTNFSALHYAIWRNYQDVGRLLLEQGANANAQDSSGMTPLMNMPFEDPSRATRLLLEYGANVSTVDENGDTALHMAVSANADLTCLRLLLAHGADPNHRDKFGETPLSLAQQGHSPDVVALLQKGAK